MMPVCCRPSERKSLLLVMVGAFLCAACTVGAGPAVSGFPVEMKGAVATSFTTRLSAHDAEAQAIAISQAAFASTRADNAPDAILLAPQSSALAFTAMQRLAHLNAPLLYLNPRGGISEATLQEMRRLRPKGVPLDGLTQVYAVGAMGRATLEALEGNLRYRVRHFSEENPMALADGLDEWVSGMEGERRDAVVVSSLDDIEGMEHGLGALGFSAQSGSSFAWVYRDSVPEATRNLLRRRTGSGTFLYLTGGSDVISDRVAAELSAFGFVRRISGSDPFETNVVNAQFKDFGRNFGWWWGWSPRDFGWGISQSGHNYVIASRSDLLGAVPAALLCRTGKHGPILLVGRDALPVVVAQYLESVRPFVNGPSATVLNHAWIVGDLRTISWEVQKQVHALLVPRTARLLRLSVDLDPDLSL